MLRNLWLASGLVVALFTSAVSAAEPTKLDLFEAKQGGYEAYRIPGIVVTAKGSLLAYCEARRTSRSDWGEIDILLRRSTDGGQTWSDPQAIGSLPADIEKNEVATAQKLGEPGKFTMNNPVAIAARDGTVHFLYCVEYARCFYLKSEDDGATFSKPVEITRTFEKFRDDYAWKVLATGPGHGVELSTGRLVVPVWLSTGTGGHAHRPSAVSTIYSDDQGKSWQRGEIIVAHGKEVVNPSETIVAELSDGRVMVNIRSESQERRRLVAISPNGATQWTKPVFDKALFEPVCMASIARLSGKQLVFANPNSQSNQRENLTVRLSDDDGQTWKWSRVLEPKFSAYSDLAVDKQGTIYCLYESGGKSQRAYGALTLAKFTADWVKGDE